MFFMRSAERVVKVMDEWVEKAEDEPKNAAPTLKLSVNHSGARRERTPAIGHLDRAVLSVPLRTTLG